jgi:hypothetical protein
VALSGWSGVHEKSEAVPDLASAMGDGVPREVPMADPVGDLRAATVDLPEEPGSEALSFPRTAHVVWDTRSGEMKVKVPVASGERTTLWVRVGDGESGDLIALARPQPDPHGGALASTVVPSGGSLGDLYVDVTNEPLSVIGSSRHRARRRASRLEGHAARLRGAGRHREARKFAEQAGLIRASLGDTSRPASKRVGSNRWWSLVVVALLVVIGALLGRNQTEVSTEPALPPVANVRILALEQESTSFAGEFPYGLSVVPGSSAEVLEFQLYDQVRFAYAGGAIENPVEAMYQCRGSIGSSTGASAGAVTAPFDVIVLGSDDPSRARELLDDDQWTAEEVFARESGSTSMLANIPEDCRQDEPDGTVYQVSRQIYGVENVSLDRSPPRYLVVRLMRPDGSAIEWTSTNVVKVD